VTTLHKNSAEESEGCAGSKSCQEFPTEGELEANMNLTREELLDKLKNEKGEIYGYLVKTVEHMNHEFCQTGSAPNFQGGLITLCTCKHYMRTWKETSNWKDLWIAGFTRPRLMKTGNYLFYLMKVSAAYQSFKKIWEYLSRTERDAKNAKRNVFGDIYQPKSDVGDEFKYSGYYEPAKGHVHLKGNRWHNDICYRGLKGRRPSLLVGDSNFSFLYSEPKIYLTKHPRTKKWDLEDLERKLEQDVVHHPEKNYS
jgi:hypothetical protein